MLDLRRAIHARSGCQARKDNVLPKRRSSESTVHDVWSAFTGHKKVED
jgi:hypothetical protein